MKNKIRDTIVQKKKALSAEKRSQLSNEVIENLQFLDEFQNADAILFYVSTKEEVETHAAIQKLLQRDEKTVLVPFVEKDNELLQISELKDFDDLCEQTFGILEPKQEARKQFDPEKIDLILIPGNVFDRNGHRIGYGHGYYDRFLKTLKHKPLKVGLAYDFQVVDEIPNEQHDVPVDVIVTDTEIIHINTSKS